MIYKQESEEQRKEDRYEHQSKVIVENLNSGPSLSGTLKNYSAGGLYFETNTLIRYGMVILIGIYSSPFSVTPQTYECHRVKIKWLRELNGKDYTYGYGAELLDTKSDNTDRESKDSEPLFVGKSQVRPEKERRKHQRKSFLKPVYFVCDHKYYAGVTKDISEGGMFISTKDQLLVGQQVNIAIPNTRFDNGRMLRAEIVRVEKDGIGAKIVGILTPKRK